jgi:hypothetical protein
MCRVPSSVSRTRKRSSGYLFFVLLKHYDHRPLPQEVLQAHERPRLGGQREVRGYRSDAYLLRSNTHGLSPMCDAVNLPEQSVRDVGMGWCERVEATGFGALQSLAHRINYAAPGAMYAVT